jgi:hypothetical protein
MVNDNFSRHRHQKAVLWQANGFNELGETTVDTPVEISVRVEVGFVETLDARGNIIATLTQMNVDREITLGSLLWIGKKKDLPDPVPEVLEVIDYVEIPSVNGRKFDRWVKVMRHSNKDPIVV